MYIDPEKFPGILTQFRDINATQQARLNAEYGFEDGAGYSQLLGPPEPISHGIPTLKKGVYDIASPMLTHRFTYASSWQDAVLSNRLLSLSEMENIWTDNDILEQIKIRAEHWENSPPAKLPLEKISLFGVNRDEGEEIYLTWLGATEPSVVEYIGGTEQKFDSIADFFLFHSQKMKQP